MCIDKQLTKWAIPLRLICREQLNKAYRKKLTANGVKMLSTNSSTSAFSNQIHQTSFVIERDDFSAALININNALASISFSSSQNYQISPAAVELIAPTPSNIINSVQLPISQASMPLNDIATKKQDVLEKYQKLIAADQIKPLKTRSTSQLENEVAEIIGFANKWKTADIESVIAVYTAFQSNNNVPIPENANNIYLFRAVPLSEMPKDPDGIYRYQGGTIKNNPKAYAIIFDLKENALRSAGKDNDQQKADRENQVINLTKSPLAGGSINFVVDKQKTLTLPYEGNLTKFYDEKKSIRIVPHTNTTSVILRCTLADVFSKQGKIYKDVRSSGTAATICVALPENESIPYTALVAHTYGQATSAEAWERLSEIWRERVKG